MIVRLLTELDAILDTRVGVMDRLDPEATVRLVKNPAYYTRQIDHFEPLCGIEEARFQDAWQRRCIDDLRHSSVTPIMEMLHCQILALETKHGMDPTLEGIELVVNLHPYQLSPEEETAIGQALVRMIGKRTPVRFVSLSPKELTPEMVRADYSGLVLYNHHDWMKLHQDYLTLRGIPRVTLVAPKLCYEKIPTAEEQNLEIDRPMDMWSFVQIMASEAIGLEFLDVEQYCTAVGQAALARQ